MPAALLFRDGFVRANAATLGAPNWLNSGGTGGAWGIASNSAQITNPVGFTFAAFQELSPYGISTKDVHIVGADGDTTSQWGVYARASSLSAPATYYYVVVSGSTLTLAKAVSGITTSLGTAAVTRTVGNFLELKIVGSVLNAWYGGVLLLSVSDTAITGAGYCGLLSNTFTGTGIVTRFDLRADDTWTFIPNKFDREPEIYTEIADYDSGFVQRNRIWQRARYHLTYGYEYLVDADVQNMEAFWQKYGEAMSFLVQDPTPVNAPATEVFGIGDGTTTAFKVRQDKITGTVSVFSDGVAQTPSIDNMDALVIFAAAPVSGAVLTITPQTAFWRVRFKSKPKFTRYPPNYWKTSVGFVQEKTLISGVPV